ncbi:hypothetical protein ACRAVF_00220 [Bradyrhizobium oligotrophicum S58]
MNVPIAVEGERRRGEPAEAHDGGGEKASQQKIADQGHRQEQEQKLKLREEHNKFLDVAAYCAALSMIEGAAKLGAPLPPRISGDAAC